MLDIRVCRARVYVKFANGAMSRASKQLLASKEPEEQALGAYVFGLVDKESSSGVGASAKQRRKMGHMMLADSHILGQFNISVADLDEVLISRANQ
jgi:hypothetical protein